MRSLALRGTVRRSLDEHRAIARACRARDPIRAEQLLRDHISVPQRRLEAAKRRGGRAQAMSLRFGVNLNNREPLIAPDYDLPMLLDLAERVEELGFDSVWVGDSLFSKPRYEPIALLSAISQRTTRVKLGTACMVSVARATRSTWRWSGRPSTSSRGGRTILGTGAGNPEEGVRREFAALGLDFGKRAAIFEEGLAVIRAALDRGAGRLPRRALRLRRRRVLLRHRDGAADAGPAAAADLGRLQPAPRRHGLRRRRWSAASCAACRRIVTLRRRLDDLLPGRASRGARGAARAGSAEVADDEGADFDRLTISYQVTMNIGDSEEEARAAFGDYIGKYYPELSKAMDLGNWGPVGTPDQIVEWLRDVRRRRGSTTSSAASARSTSSGRWSASPARSCRRFSRESRVR